MIRPEATDEAIQAAGAITPMPGSEGSATITMLMSNAVRVCELF